MSLESFVGLAATILTVAGGAFASTYHVGKRIGTIETKLDAVADDVKVIRTNELFHINKRVENVERVLMGDRYDRTD